MSNSAIAGAISSIPSSQSARISITATTGETVHLDCIYRAGAAPDFFLSFPSGNLPANIDRAVSCLVSIRSGDENAAPITLNATIGKIIEDSMLELTAKSLMDPTTLRQYFRVAISAPVTLSFEKKTEQNPSGFRSLAGETLDLSGSGLLGIFSQECNESQQITITLVLPSPQGTVSCTGHVVHSRRVRRGHYQIALHFDDISNKQRDIILSNCLSEQRRQLSRELNPG